mmetsp:Transcript_2341/g.5737  ORF Transcript_2341/g.5737 Transcript_2341/m.5737 type:complete len:304 (+) Transcript_2341:684-1595(+)
MRCFCGGGSPDSSACSWRVRCRWRQTSSRCARERRPPVSKACSVLLTTPYAECSTSRPPGSGVRPSPSVDVSLAMACVPLAWRSRLSCSHGPQPNASSRPARCTVLEPRCPHAAGPLSSVLTASSVGQVLTVLQPEISSWSSSKPAAAWHARQRSAELARSRPRSRSRSRSRSWLRSRSIRSWPSSGTGCSCGPASLAPAVAASHARHTSSELSRISPPGSGSASDLAGRSPFGSGPESGLARMSLVKLAVKPSGASASIVSAAMQSSAERSSVMSVMGEAWAAMGEASPAASLGSRLRHSLG